MVFYWLNTENLHIEAYTPYMDYLFGFTTCLHGFIFLYKIHISFLIKGIFNFDKLQTLVIVII